VAFYLDIGLGCRSEAGQIRVEIISLNQFIYILTFSDIYWFPKHTRMCAFFCLNFPVSRFLCGDAIITT